MGSLSCGAHTPPRLHNLVDVQECSLAPHHLMDCHDVNIQEYVTERLNKSRKRVDQGEKAYGCHFIEAQFS